MRRKAKVDTIESKYRVKIKNSRVARLRRLRESRDILLSKVRSIKSPEDRLGPYLYLIDRDD